MTQVTNYLIIDGHRIAYHRQGKGEHMLLIHGITTYSFLWRNMIPPLAEDYDVIAVDLLGCGDSDKPAGADYSISAQADIIKKLMKELGIDKAHLVTHDIGGGVGQIISVRYAKCVYDLVLINSVAYDYWPVQPITAMRVPLLRQIGMGLMDIGLLRIIIRHGVYHKERITDELMKLFYRPLLTGEGKRGFLQLAKCLNNRQLMEIADKIRELKMPVLIIRGEADSYLGSEIAERLHAEIKNSSLQRIQTGGHFIQEDEPELLVKLIKEFIQS